MGEPAIEYTDQEIQSLNEWVGYLSYKPCFLLNSLLKCHQKIIMLNTGNQAGKNDAIAKHYVMRLLGQHPIEKKNMRPDTAIRTLRFAAQTLPMEPDGQGEVRNTVYPALKRRLPPGMIKKDVTIRKPVMILYDPQGGPDIVVEFVSYGQQTQSQAGVQRWSVYLDEQAPHDFFQEQLPRLLASGGDLVIGLTPLEGVTYLYEEVYQRAEVMYSSNRLIEYMKETHDKDLLPVEVYDRTSGIAIIRCATDDNPTFTKSQVDETMNQYDNEADYEVRRYGIFHQISGVIFKEYDPKIHFINQSTYFPEGMPHEWLHARGIDFHEHTNWACSWICLSKWNEAFVYNEYNPSPDRMVTMDICRQVAHQSLDYKYILNLIDPWAVKKQLNTGLTPLDDMNRYFSEFKHEGIGTGGYWMPWDTKSARGRDVIKERLKNARLVGRPFNNRVVDKTGRESHLPTIWIMNNCIKTDYMMRNWRWEEWADRDAYMTKDEKNKPQDRNSHFPVTLECIFKHPGFSIGRFGAAILPHRASGYERVMHGRA